MMNFIYTNFNRWDRKNQTLKDPKPMELTTPLPPIHFHPVEKKKGKQAKGVYTCPLYYFPQRSGTRERPSFIGKKCFGDGISGIGTQNWHSRL